MACASVSSIRRWVKGFCGRSEALRSVGERFGVAAMGSVPEDVAECLFEWNERMFEGGIERMIECAAMGLMWAWPQVGLFMSLT